MKHQALKYKPTKGEIEENQEEDGGTTFTFKDSNRPNRINVRRFGRRGRFNSSSESQLQIFYLGAVNQRHLQILLYFRPPHFALT